MPLLVITFIALIKLIIALFQHHYVIFLTHEVLASVFLGPRGRCQSTLPPTLITDPFAAL